MLKSNFRKAFSLFLVFLLLFMVIPFSEFTPTAVAADSALTSAITSEAQAKAAAIRSAVNAAMPVTPAQIVPTVNSIKQEIDTATDATIDGLNKLKTGFDSDLATWKQIVQTGGFMTGISTPDPAAIKIYTAEDLAGIANDMSGSYVLMNDIDLSQYNGGNWIPPSGSNEYWAYGDYNDDFVFKGTLDGQGHTIRNMKLSSEYIADKYFYYTNNLGMFLRINGATIKNLSFDNANIEVLIGWNDLDLSIGVLCSEMTGSTIANCNVHGNISLTGGSGVSLAVVKIGGLSGSCSSASIGSLATDCFSDVDIHYECDAGIREGYIGGVFGMGVGQLERCYNKGNIILSGSESYNGSYILVGGIVGYGNMINASILSGLYNAGDILAERSGSITSSIGGIAGRMITPLSACFNTGNILTTSANSSWSVGGIVGETQSLISGCYNTGFIGNNGEIIYDDEPSSALVSAGGIASRCDNVENCYNAGTVRGVSAGGIACAILASSAKSTFITNCWNDGEVTARSRAGGIAGSANSSDSACNFDACYNTGNVTTWETRGNNSNYAGGILGIAYADKAYISISNCCNAADISSSLAGGIAGDVYSSLSIEYCRNTGDITPNKYIQFIDSGAGGILNSVAFGNHEITLCYNTGTVSGHNSVAGIIQYCTDFPDAGATPITISRCLNLGSLSGGYIKGIGGGSTVNNCFNTADITGDPAFTTSIEGIGGGFSKNCVNTGNIYLAPDEYGTRSISGITHDSAENCYNAGNITVVETVFDNSMYDYHTTAAGISRSGDVKYCRNAGKIQGARYASGIGGWYFSHIDSCHNLGSVSVVTNHYSEIGGIATLSRSISDCLNEGSISVDFTDSTGVIGGIVASVGDIENIGTVTGCINLANVRVVEHSHDYWNWSDFGVGGIAGAAGGVYIISDCYNMGSLNTTSNDDDLSYAERRVNKVGGIVGIARAFSVLDDTEPSNCIKKCSNTANIEVSLGTAGGIVGRIEGSGFYRDTIVSGYSATITAFITVADCRNTGNVSSAYSNGGIVGEVDAYCEPSTYQGIDVQNMHNVLIQGNQNTGNIAQTGNSVYRDSRTGSLVYNASGGIVGRIHDGNTSMDDRDYGTVENPPDLYANRCSFGVTLFGCTNYGAVYANWQAGGMVGAIASSTHLDGVRDSLTVTNCRNEGDVSVQGNMIGSRNAVAGGIIGGTAALASTAYNAPNTVTISGCTNNGSITAYINHEEYSFAGGIIARVPRYNVEITFCDNNGDVYGDYAGGILSSDWSNYSAYLSYSHNISRCSNAGSISGINAGGIVGEAMVCAVFQCSNEGTVSGENVGGIVGQIYNSLRTASDLAQCVNYGMVSTSLFLNTTCGGHAGGIIGYYSSGSPDRVYLSDSYNVGDVIAAALGSPPYGGNYAPAKAYAGGIVGFAQVIEIRNCYTAGDIVYADTGSHASTYAGGIAGITNTSLTSIIDDCAIITAEIHADWPAGYWSSEETRPNASVVSVGTPSGGSIARNDIRGNATQDATGIEATEFYKPATFTARGWDFNTVWEQAPGGRLPVLQWQNLTIGPPIPNWSPKILSVRNGYVDNATRTVFISVPYETPSSTIDVTVSYGASWALYGNPECTNLIADKTMKDLQVGENLAYIRVTADGSTSVVYKVILNKSPEGICINYKTGSVYVYFPDTLFERASTAPDSSDLFDLMLVAAALNAASSGNAEYLRGSNGAYAKLGFSMDKYFDYPTNDNADFPDIDGDLQFYTKNEHCFSIAVKEITVSGKKELLIAVILRGTESTVEGEGDWLAKANTPFGDEKAYDYFYSYYTKVRTALNRYYNAYNWDYDGYKLLISGHSLGGAAANLLAASFVTDNTGVYMGGKLGIDDIYAFTFGALNSVEGTPKNNLRFNYIKNVFNHYDDYGNSFDWRDEMSIDGITGNDRQGGAPLKGKTTSEKFGIMKYINKDFRGVLPDEWDWCGIFYENFVNHNMHGYITAILNGEVGKLSQKYYRVVWKCPVDVEIFTNTGELVGSIANNVIDEGAKLLDAYVGAVGDVKYALLPSESQYLVKMTGTGEGTLGMTIETLGPEDDSSDESKCFIDIALYNGKTMTSMVGGDIDTPDIRLFVLNDQGDPIAEVMENGDETPISDAVSLGGSASISGMNAIGEILSINTDSVTGGSGSFGYQWQAGGANVGTNSDTYTIAGTDAGKTITCIVTRADATGSVSATFDSGDTVPYNVTVDNVGDETGDTVVTLSPTTGRAGDSITLSYGLADLDVNNTLTFTGTHGLIDVMAAGDSVSQSYVIDASDAVDGVITITATFLHTDLLIQTLTFAMGNQSKVYGDSSFSNVATGEGTGTVDYSSSNSAVASVASDGTVTIEGAGSAMITASIPADGTYAAASATYTVTVANASQDAPTGVGATDETAMLNDGTITGVDSTMEYKLSAATPYTAITGATVTGLAPGTYLVRYAAKTNYDAGADATVTIAAYTPAATITLAAIPGVTKPVRGATPVTTIDSAQYSGTISWSPTASTFAASTVYTATISLTAKPGYTLTGVAADFFTVAGTSSPVTNNVDSGVVTAVFPATDAASSGTTGGGGGGSTTTNPSGSFSGGSAYTPGGSTGLVYTVNKDFSQFDYVSADNVRLTRDQDYTAVSGSTRITLLPAYLDNLKAGSHTVAVNFKDGTRATASFTVAAAKESPVKQTLTPVREEQPGAVNTNAGAATPFSDASAGDWFNDAVKYVYDNGLMNGTSADLFSPNANLTRGMVVTVLYRLEGNPGVNGGAPFSDVAFGQWYTEAIAWAASSGIVTGMTATTYEPETDVTREQLATILYRYAVYTGSEPVNGSAADLGFADAGQIAAWAVDGAVFCSANGIITGKPGTLFDPQGNATRAEFATMLMRFLGA